ncbi:unnamed protein product [Meganyctiphanes norvegica]|uniref:Uncharacterized protein n=1 Tax=Meganyctiphanes norvegica TaxID=48144 RepID=A0AAV2RSP5_MEGNR
MPALPSFSRSSWGLQLSWKRNISSANPMEKQYLLCFLLAQIFKILNPQASDASLLSMAIWKNLVGSISSSLVSILCVWIMSPLYLLSISVVSTKASSLSSKDLPFRTGIIFVAIFWTPYIKFIMSCLYGDKT